MVAEQFRYTPQIVEMQPEDALYLWSDGIIETMNPAHEMFGESRLLALFANESPHTDMFARITGSLRDFSQQGSQSDDYSLVEVRLRETLEQKGPLPRDKSEKRCPVGNWSLEYELRAESLRSMDPVPLLMHMLLQGPGLRAQSGTINTILNELYSNALEHGVLGLESALKNSADGFRQYYQLRAERLQQLEQACIRIRAEVLPEPDGGVLRLQIKDSGKGFEFVPHAATSQNPAYYGRGLTLVAALCRRVEYAAPGNEVLVEFAWRENGQ
jgi:anti-sigma regulatory factor (Ser/Thr protein kinase)